MINLLWLGRPWEEVRKELSRNGVDFQVKVTQAPKGSVGEGKYRIVRLRERGGLEVTLAHELVREYI